MKNLAAHDVVLNLLRAPLPLDATPDKIATIHSVFCLCHRFLQVCNP